MTIRVSTRLAALAVAAAATVVLSACSSSGGTGPATGTLAKPSAAAAAPEAGTILTANSTDKLGLVVVDGQGYTLYRFDKDTSKPPASNCSGECAQKWPPVLATPGTPLTVKGVAQNAVGTINRPDGSIQLTLGGWPVYRYSGDTTPGAITGQGISGTWAAVRPNGGKAATDTTGAAANTGATSEAKPGAQPDAKPSAQPGAGPAAPPSAAADDSEPVSSGY